MFHWSDKIRQEFRNPKNIGELDVSKANVYLAEVKTPDGFTHMQLFIEIKDEKIVNAKFKVLGCPCCIACLSYLTQQLTGRDAIELKQISAQNLIGTLELPKERYSSALLAEELCKNLFKQVF